MHYVMHYVMHHVMHYYVIDLGPCAGGSGAHPPTNDIVHYMLHHMLQYMLHYILHYMVGGAHLQPLRVARLLPRRAA